MSTEWPGSVQTGRGCGSDDKMWKSGWGVVVVVILIIRRVAAERQKLRRDRTDGREGKR
jgi:hypothetical protein